MTPRPPLAPRPLVLGLVALGALVLVAWLGTRFVAGETEPESAAAFAPGAVEAAAPRAAAEGLVAAPGPAVPQAEGAQAEPAPARREDPNETRWGAEYWSLRVLDPSGDPLPSRGVRVSVDGRQTMGFTDRDARLHLTRQAGARELEVAMRSTGPTSTWWVGRLALPEEGAQEAPSRGEEGALDLGSVRLVGEDQGSLQVLLPTGEPWSHGALQLNGRSISLDVEGRVSLPPHNRWGERLELQHPSLSLPATVPDRLGDDGLPLQLNWSRRTLVVMGGWGLHTRLSVHARDPEVPEEDPKNIYALNWGTGDLGSVQLEKSTLLDYTVWVASEAPPAAVDIRVHHPLWRRPLASRSLRLGSLVGNVGSPWITEPNRWADRATVQLVDSAGEPLEGVLEALEDPPEELGGQPGGEAALRRVAFDQDLRFSVSAGAPSEVWLPSSGSNRVMATGADGRAAIHTLRPGEQVLRIAEPLRIEVPLPAEAREDPDDFLSAMLEADGDSTAPRGWRSDTQSGKFPRGTVHFTVPAPGRYHLMVVAAHFKSEGGSYRLHDSNSLEEILLRGRGRWHLSVEVDGSVTTSWD